MVSLVGTNGAGKSTLAKVITGICKDPEGNMLFRGEPMDSWTIHERSSKIGYVMQNPNQMICKSMIYDEVALGLKLRGMTDEEVETLQALMRRVIENLADETAKLSTLSDIKA